MKRLAVFFPGIGYTVDKPLMHYSRRLAEKHGFDYFTTVMTISRQKNSLILNSIGKELEAKHSKTKYFYSDFKKHDGALIGVNMRKGYDLYYQKYCGCEFSLESRLKWDAYKASLNQKLDVK